MQGNAVVHFSKHLVDKVKTENLGSRCAGFWGGNETFSVSCFCFCVQSPDAKFQSSAKEDVLLHRHVSSSELTDQTVLLLLCLLSAASRLDATKSSKLVCLET